MYVFLLAPLEGPGRVEGHRLMHSVHGLRTYFCSSNCVKGIKTRLKAFKTFAKAFNQTEQVSIHVHRLQFAFIKKTQAKKKQYLFSVFNIHFCDILFIQQ